MPEENFFLIILVAQGAEDVAHTPFGYHFACHRCRLLDIVTGAGGHAVLAVDPFLGDPATEHHRQLGLEFLHRIAVAIAFGQVHGQAQRAPTWNDRHLVQRIVAGHADADQGVARFVISGQRAFGVGHHHRAPLRAHHHLVLGLLELGHGDHALGLARRQQRGLVDQVGEIGAGETRSPARDHPRLDVGR